MCPWNKIAESTKLFKRLSMLISKGEFVQAEAVLLELKVNLTEFLALPPLYHQTPTAGQELTLVKYIFERAVLLSLKTEDQVSFERHFVQLRSFYDIRDVIPASPYEYTLLGYNLLRLLVQNRIAEFHAELELLTPEARGNASVKSVLKIEQSFMEGAYFSVLKSLKSMKMKTITWTYKYFMDLLAETVRDEIAGCSEKAYDFLTVQDAKNLLMFSTDDELLEYVGEQHPDWEVRSGAVYFHKMEVAPYKKMIPFALSVRQLLCYARELERIV